jgi:hypothetical protein
MPLRSADGNGLKERAGDPEAWNYAAVFGDSSIYDHAH